MTAQLALFGQGSPLIDNRFREIQRRDLGAGAWVDYQPGWLTGDSAIFSALVESTRWHSDRRTMYDREVQVPRLLAPLPDDGPGHPILACAAPCRWRLIVRTL